MMNEPNEEMEPQVESEEPTQPSEQVEDSQEASAEESSVMHLEPEQVTITYPGFKDPTTEEQLHYELATLDVLIKTLETRKAKLNRNWTHHKLNVFLNSRPHEHVEESSDE